MNLSTSKRRRVSKSSPKASCFYTPSPTMISHTFQYTDEDHKSFEEKGYIVKNQFLSRTALKILRGKVDAVYATKPASVHDEWVLGLHQMLPDDNNWIRDLATEPKLLDMVEKHLGPNLVLFSTQLATKRPNSGKTVPWHQDGERCRTVWIPLDDVDESNGALRVMPGVHKLGRLKYQKVQTVADTQTFEFFHSYRLYASDVESVQQSGSLTKNIVTCVMPGGGIEMHHPCLPHSSLPNNTHSQNRRAIILRYQPSSEPVEAGDIYHWQTGTRMTKVNYLVRGTHELLGAETTTVTSIATSTTATIAVQKF